MLYSKIAEYYERIGETSKGLEKTEIVADFLNEIKNEPETIYLLQGRFFPDYDERESGISEQLAIKAIAKASGVKEEEVVKEFKKTGEIGSGAEKIFSKKRQATLFSSKLTSKRVIEQLRKLPEMQGKGTVEKKMGLIVEILNAASPLEAKYIIRTLLGDLKAGIGLGIIRDGIVRYCFAPESAEEKKAKGAIVQNAYDIVTDMAEVFVRACEGEEKLREVGLSPGKPVKVMLYPKALNIEDAFSIVGKPAAFEYKYDGFRMMINKDENGKVSIFTRRLDNVTKQFPDAEKYALEYIKGGSFIIDCEAVGYDPKTKKYRPFQDISQRIKRKYDIEKLEKELPVELVVFDVLYYDGKSLIETPFIERRKIVEKIVREEEFRVKVVEQIITDDAEEAEKFYVSALEDKQEGLIGKNLNAIYKPGARVGYGVKIKPNPLELDLVITGAEYGTGKRAGWLTSFDVSCKNGNELLEVGKVSTGLKEKEEEGLSFIEMTKELKKIILSEEGKHVKVEPKIVVAVGYQNIQKSPSYSSGYALRFPRMISLRPDKPVDEIASLNEIRKSVED